MLQHSGRESKANCESDSLSFSLSGPYLPPSTSTLPFSSLSQHLSSCLHLCRTHFRWQEGGGRRGEEGTGMIVVVVVVGVRGGGVGVWGSAKGGGKQKVARWLHNNSKAGEGGHSSLGEDASPSSCPPLSSSPCSKKTPMLLYIKEEKVNR